MPIVGGVSTGGGGGGGGGTNSTQTETRHEALAPMVAETSIVSLGETTSGAVTYVDVPCLATAWIQYPAGYNGNVRASGTKRDGTAGTETLINTGAGIVRGSTPFVGRITYENLTPGGNGSHNAQLGYSKRLCAATAPVVEFLAAWDGGNGIPMALSATVDLTNGWAQLTDTPDPFAPPHIVYRVSHTHTIS